LPDFGRGLAGFPDEAGDGDGDSVYQKAIGNVRVDGKNFFQVILLMEFSDLT